MYEDPGWRPPRKSRNESPTVLTSIRIVFMAFATGVVLFGLVALFVILTAEKPQEDPGVGLALVMLGFGVLAQILVTKLERPLDGTSEGSLLNTYRGRTIIRSAVAEGGALLGIVAALISVRAWVLLVAALIGAVGFVRAAPTAAAIQRDEERLQAQGSPFSLMAALRRPVGPEAG